MRGTQDNGRTVRLLENVQLMHNGYLMQCDSANYFPSNNSFEAFGNIVIFKAKTFLYGETLHYDGNTNIAQVRGKIVRLVDDKTVLRTFFLDFNTKQSVGYFYGGGTMDDKENVLESDKGYYYSNEKLAKFEGTVEMRNKEYDIYSDSLHYHTDREFTVFLGSTNIWHKDGFLSCESGWYDKPRNYFHFSKKAYVLSKKQEMWADSIFYDRSIEKSTLYGNIQLLDTTRSVLAFGDEGYFENESRETWLMRNPSIAYYEVDEEGKSDTLFLRADTLHFLRIPNPALYPKDSVTSDGLRVTSDTLNSYELQVTSYVSDSLSNVSDTLDNYELRITNYEEFDEVNDELDNIPKLDSIPKVEEIPILVAQDSLKVQDSPKVQELPEIQDLPTVQDSLEVRNLLEVQDSIMVQSLLEVLDSLEVQYLFAVQDLSAPQDSLLFPSPLQQAGDTLASAIDSVLQYFFAYRNVRIFRSDAQGTCDSLVYFLNDSLGLMYHNPVLWNDGNQISADSMRFITKHEELYRAEFLSSAFIASEEDSIRFNQIKGRDMYGYFRDNELYLLDVKANVQTVFYMTEEDIITNVIIGESKNMQIYVKERKMSRIKYLDSPEITIHPLDMLSENQQQLKGLNWRDAERPKTRYEVCHREVLPSQRAETQLLEKPTFSITTKIDGVR
jgi:lipopolysaccharide export system protein LptA